MKSRAPLNEGVIYDQPSVINLGWASWFSLIPLGIPWNIGLIKSATLDFGNILAQTQAGLPVTVTGARTNVAVQVTPATDVSGIIFIGVVTGNNTVTVYAKNFSASAINPAPQVFKIIVLD